VAVDKVLELPEAIEFWDKRHQAQGELLSGGDLSFDHAGNEIFYALRTGRLIDIVGDASSVVAPKRVLDAGCGKGVFSRAMGRFGHRVDGIDSSPHAIDLCRADASTRETYAVSTLDAWTPPYLYDAVYCVDVLFHIMDDDVWEASLRNLAALVTFGGVLALADHVGDEDRLWSKYQKTRASSRYDSVLAPHGMRRDGFSPYRFRGSPAGFHLFTKVQ
jgi:2-polyprenyl-3-methyl-5-hydroxy-6-metoxy-1,4-benzoquinol methylase